MLFAPDWQADVAHLTDTEPAPARELFSRWAWTLLERGQGEAALHRARIGTEQFPEYATGWYVLARAQATSGLFDAAAGSTERCLGLEPDFIAAWELLADVNRGRGRQVAARAALARLEELRTAPVESPAPERAPEPPPRKLVLVRREPEKSFETPTLAEVYRRQGLLDRALEVYHRILDRHPEDTGVRAMVHKLEAELAARRRPVEKT